MNRAEFLRRAAGAAVAVQTFDPKLLESALEEPSIVCEVVEPSGKATVAAVSDIIRNYYLPTVVEALNGDSVLLTQLKPEDIPPGGIRIPLHFGRTGEYGTPSFQQVYGRATIKVAA